MNGNKWKLSNWLLIKIVQKNFRRSRLWKDLDSRLCNLDWTTTARKQIRCLTGGKLLKIKKKINERFSKIDRGQLCFQIQQYTNLTHFKKSLFDISSNHVINFLLIWQSQRQNDIFAWIHFEIEPKYAVIAGVWIMLAITATNQYLNFIYILPCLYPKIMIYGWVFAQTAWAKFGSATNFPRS